MVYGLNAQIEDSCHSRLLQLQIGSNPGLKPLLRGLNKNSTQVDVSFAYHALQTSLADPLPRRSHLLLHGQMITIIIICHENFSSSSPLFWDFVSRGWDA